MTSDEKRGLWLLLERLRADLAGDRVSTEHAPKIGAAVDWISRQLDAPDASVYLITIKDKTLLDEPDVALGVVSADSEDNAIAASHSALEQLAEAGRARCVPRARMIELGRIYNLHTVVRVTSRDRPTPAERVVELARLIGQHWRDQEGVNGALLDELAALTMTKENA